jgi:hypothetical protein
MVESGFSSSSQFIFPNPTQLVSIKLDKTNYLAWTAQFKHILKSHNLLGFIDDSNIYPTMFVDDNAAKNKSVNPAYISWQSRDQLLLSWIISSTLVAFLYGLDSSFLAWQPLVARFASQSKSRISYFKLQLQNLQQGSLTCASYLAEAKFLADQLSTIGKLVDDDDLISFIIGALNNTFAQFITSYSFHIRETSMSFFDFRSEMLNHEIILNHHAPLNPAPKTSSFASFTLFTNRPKFQPVKCKIHFFRSSNTNVKKPNFSLKPASSTSTNGVRSVSNSSGRSPCQICKGNNHQELECFRRMDFSFQGCHPPTNLAAMVVDINVEFLNCQWLADSGANAHVTNNAENLDSKRLFDGNEIVGVGNGASLSIKHTGSSIVHSHNNHFLLKNIIHCPQAATN